MNQEVPAEHRDSHRRLEEAYRSEKPRLLARLRAAGRSLEDAEDLVHDVYAEVMAHLPLVAGIRNLSAWINSLFTRRLIDSWRHERVRAASGETDVAEETLREIISAVGLDPLDGLVRSCLADAVNDALRVLPAAQRSGHRGAGVRRTDVPRNSGSHGGEHRYLDRPQALRPAEPLPCSAALDRSVSGRGTGTRARPLVCAETTPKEECSV